MGTCWLCWSVVCFLSFLCFQLAHLCFAFLLSLLVMRVQVAHMGVTIAAVIHQPSYEIFQMFDDILLLAKGGRTAFYGPEGQVQSYFEKLGYALPQRTNPPDVYMDIIAGIKSRVDGPPQTPQVQSWLQMRLAL
jgi:ABC-type multidrug transport system ATPase subunit